MADSSRNSPDDFIGLLEIHRAQIFGLIFAIVQDVADSEDVFQKTSLELWKNFDRYQPGSDFLHWARSVARSRAIDHLRAQHRDRHFFSAAVLDQLVDSKTQSDDDNGDRAKALSLCVEKLNGRDNDLLRRCYRCESSSIKSVAAEIGRPVGAVYTSLSRIRRILFLCVQRALAREERA